MTPIPITIITGFLGSGKTTILLNLIPQLPKDYKLALLKNEFGDVAVDSQLASEQSISGVRELLNGCICCNLVGQLSDALFQLRDEVSPDRIIIETSGSAFPATLAMEVKRLMREHEGSFELDGVISVIDVENWQGYEDTSYTAKMQAKFTDLVILNKWEVVPEQRLDICIDRLGDMEVHTAWVKSEHGRVEKDLLLGLDSKLLASDLEHQEQEQHEHAHDHQTEVDVLSVTLTHQSPSATINTDSFIEKFLDQAPKDEVYRIKGIIRFSDDHLPTDNSGQFVSPPFDTAPSFPVDDSTVHYHPGSSAVKVQNYILNWAFSRYTFTPGNMDLLPNMENNDTVVARLTVVLARGSANAWKYKLNKFDWVSVGGETLEQRKLLVEKIE
ncbi:hypothetical protein KEM56_001159 [Ascosphaera pollenicola]|nr:hypothetical protein KEM56_001159 [Ascosphaera pollenicola]